MKRGSALLLLVLSSLFFGCGGEVLPFPEKETSDAVMLLAASMDAENSTVADGLSDLNDILLEVYADKHVPIPPGSMVPYIPSKIKPYTGADAFRWGYGLPTDPENEDTTGAFVARPLSVGYLAMLPLAVEADRSTILDSNFRENNRVYAAGEAAAFLAGESDLVVSANHSVLLAPKGIVFEYDTHTTVRRIRDERLPGGEAMIAWELLDGEAERIEGGYGAYLRYLKNLNILFPLSDKLSFWVVASWSETGGSALGISVSGSSGDIAEQVRRDYSDWEDYFAEQDLTCLPDGC